MVRLRSFFRHTPNHWMVALLILSASASADCGPNGQDYLRLAERALASDNLASAATSIARAHGEDCRSYALEMRLGEGQEFEGLFEDALTTYDGAQQSAASRPQQALAVGQYARVLNELGERQDALALLQTARKLDPDAPQWVHDLAFELDQALADQPFTRDRVTRSFSTSSMGRLSPGSIQPVQQAAAAVVATTIAETVTASTTEPEQPSSLASLPFRVLFKVNSSALDPSEDQTVAELAEGLADPELGANKRFWFIGHTDARGDASYNMRLSQARASEVQRRVEALKPELAGRIRTRGMGEEDLLYPNASGEAQHRLNRRVEVLME